MKIKRDLLTEIMDIAQIDDDALGENYSGRYMFGRSCPSVSVDGTAQLAAFFAAAGVRFQELQEAEEPDFDLEGLAKGVCTDSLGRGLVFYWPDLELEE